MSRPEIENQRRNRVWLGVALLIGAFYSALALHAAFAASELVQDDARQHVFWAARYRNPSLFPNDLIADYFQAVAPIGYKAIYWTGAKIGIGPLFLSRMLPAVIGLVVAWLAFKLAFRLTSSGIFACLGSLFITQVMWSKDDVASASPRAFAYPLLLAFLLALIQNRAVLSLILVALAGLIYPQIAFVCAGAVVLGIFQWRDGRVGLSVDRARYFKAVAAIAIVLLTLAPFASAVARYGPAMTRSEAIHLPEFQQFGRWQTFVDPVDFWLTSAPTGLLPTSLPRHVAPLIIIGALILLLRHRREVLANAEIIRLLAASIVLWALAHLFLFRLHLPARYSQYTLRILLPLLAIVPIHWLLDKMPPGNRVRTSIMLAIIGLLAVAPFVSKKFPNAEYIPPRSGGLDAFLRSQPRTALIATLRPMASTIPVFARRSVLVSAEHAVAYHAGYYHQVRQRGHDLVRAHLTSDPQELRAFIDRYHIDLFVVPRQPTTPADIAKLRWYREITRGDPPDPAPAALPQFVDSCRIWENQSDIVLDAHRIVQRINQQNVAPP